MNESELKKWVRDEIQRQLVVIQNASAGGSDGQKETIDNLYPGSPSIPERPLMHPFGFVSRATKKVISIVARIGQDPSNRMVLGHRDSNRPANLEEGESAIYSSAGYQIRAMIDGIRLVKGDTRHALLLGDDVITVLASLLDLIIAHTHGPPGTPPSNAVDFTNLKVENLASTTLLSTKDGGFT